MARAIWTGSISFGLVTIPVGVYSATDDHAIHFHQLERGTGDRIRNRRVNERTQREVDYADIVKGRDLGGGEYVVVEREELDAIAPGRSRSLDIDGFVGLDEIDPVYFQRTYWLAPGGESSRKPYQLLATALERLNRVGIATFVMRGKEYLAAIRADGDVLALQTLYFADEVRDPADLDNVPGKRAKGGSDKELDMATGLIESMSAPWKPEQSRDSYQDRVQKLIEDKRKGREIVTESEPAEPTGMSDLLEALQRSVEAARGGAKKGAAEKKKPKKRKGKRAGPDLSAASKSELLAMARELKVSGRSSMSRDQLVDALRAAS